jgi:type I restriction enzyme M protein
VINGELKSKIDRVWDAFWSGGISNPLEVIEQITYLLFIRRLDDIQKLAEKRPASPRTPSRTLCSCPAKRACGGVSSRTPRPR